ncbi:glycosyltransferase [Candidatus Nanohalovita haloferacivicina]|uniref:glycosyltransferase n=1 Tax=Candidatus Nanohalovita haloferacivicina TaxID=2978046 RepID=UPI00325FD343|nr:1,2-diacylglycerol 3-alpha-glucosyltransferase [Candidatus Nanohalobia archaeon BNXNv]
MKIGFFTESYFPKYDGVTYTLKAWKERLEERGHEVYIMYPQNPEYDPGDGEIPVRSIPNPFYEGYRAPFPVRGSKLPDFDIVHCHGPITLGWSGLLQAKLEDKPSVYTHHTPIEEYFINAVKLPLLAKICEKVYLPIENFFMSKFDVVTASTSRINRKVDFTRLPVGLDMEFFQPQDESILDEMDVERPVIGYSGRLSLEKNVDNLVCFADEFDGSVVIVGEGPQEKKLKEMAGDNVFFRDFLDREDLPGFYSGLDAFVTSSTGDTLGLAPLEANSCGTPVVAADNPPFDETIGSRNGERFELGDSESLSRAIHKALNNSYECRSAVKDFSLSSTIEQLEDIYEELGEKYGQR